MENIILNNGKTVQIFSNKDIIEVIQDNCSYELGNIIAEKIEDIDSEKLYAEHRAMTDADSFLSDLEEKECCLTEVLESIQSLKKYMNESKKTNKDKIYEKLNNVIKLIENEL